MFLDDVLTLLEKRDGLSDREITDVLRGRDQPQQATHQACRKLKERGLIARREREDGILGNYLSRGPRPENALPRNEPHSVFTVEVPEDLRSKARELGSLWAASDKRPRVRPSVQAHWDRLIDEWIATPELPLALRKQAQAHSRGSVVQHAENGREVIWTDNSPAQWAFLSAWRSHEYSMEEIKELLSGHKIPFAFASKRSDMNVKYRGRIGSTKVDLNKLGWKLCHIQKVSIASRIPPEQMLARNLEQHFALLMKPSNHFVVPKQWAGFGEIPEVIDEMRRFQNREGVMVPDAEIEYR